MAKKKPSKKPARTSARAATPTRKIPSTKSSRLKKPSSRSRTVSARRAAGTTKQSRASRKVTFGTAKRPPRWRHLKSGKWTRDGKPSRAPGGRYLSTDGKWRDARKGHRIVKAPETFRLRDPYEGRSLPTRHDKPAIEAIRKILERRRPRWSVRIGKLIGDKKDPLFRVNVKYRHALDGKGIFTYNDLVVCFEKMAASRATERAFVGRRTIIIVRWKDGATGERGETSVCNAEDWAFAPAHASTNAANYSKRYDSAALGDDNIEAIPSSRVMELLLWVE